jgi:hypothetical protein
MYKRKPNAHTNDPLPAQYTLVAGVTSNAPCDAKTNAQIPLPSYLSFPFDRHCRRCSYQTKKQKHLIIPVRSSLPAMFLPKSESIFSPSKQGATVIPSLTNARPRSRRRAPCGFHDPCRTGAHVPDTSCKRTGSPRLPWPQRPRPTARPRQQYLQFRDR